MRSVSNTAVVGRKVELRKDWSMLHVFIQEYLCILQESGSWYGEAVQRSFSRSDQI